MSGQRRYRLASLASLMLTLIGTLAGAHAEAGEDNDPGVAGTYWVSIQGDFPSLPALLAFTADGRIVAVEAQGPETSGLGSWETRGRRGVAGAFIWFLSLDPAQGGVEGSHYLLIGRVDFRGEFDQSRNAARLPFTVGLFSSNQNPLVDAPFFSVNGVMTATRLRIAR